MLLKPNQIEHMDEQMNKKCFFLSLAFHFWMSESRRFICCSESKVVSLSLRARPSVCHTSVQLHYTEFEGATLGCSFFFIRQVCLEHYPRVQEEKFLSAVIEGASLDVKGFDIKAATRKCM